VDERRSPWDMPAYLTRVRSGCFVCGLLNGNPDYFHHIAYKVEVAVVFLNKYPAVRGHLLVAHQRAAPGLDEIQSSGLGLAISRCT